MFVHREKLSTFIGADQKHKAKRKVLLSEERKINNYSAPSTNEMDFTVIFSSFSLRSSL
jgi:hypothetical protein